ncbi:basic-leucine zipper transcription factor [Phycomyces blakesleeanus]|uniref:Basic-leucine zipper transcription factor n=2 Tax=Phycomyces blakesleeanus TaxID=4837 RepID=A0A162NIU3_PHYB8|nr:basic-leucine zipper transcription factor [Phycomyces blakesleeanus NRRL 1555(-)]OAD74638.1 basic-leucine zipper transcription factor [Phycomyces blakesleeanus NRRL 1555(-)]|eukprot:XP_018292678.1 basic-leucine zipper transcription factor [Phycomyces blakesleeanus NRRL 1555(-)]
MMKLAITMQIPSDPKLKRKLQNRESQRASRKRKDVYMNELQTKLQTFEDSKAESMIKAQEDNAKLKKMVEQLRVTKTALENKLSSLFGPNSFKDFMKKKSTPPSTPPAIFASSSTLIQSPMPNSSFSTDQENDDPQMYFLPRKKPSEETGELVMPTDPTSLHPIYSTTPRPKELVESWERFSKHPRFDDIDLDFVCTEMKKKAQITDHNEKLNSIIELHYPA